LVWRLSVLPSSNMTIPSYSEGPLKFYNICPL
jgi:hypothetical protein